MSGWVVKTMKWQKPSADFISEKTFLVIEKDLDLFKDNTTTWPPKVKKISSKLNVIDRPKTANLEKPNILNPDLMDKLDMSLISKDSLSRIQLGGHLSGGASSTSSSSKRRRHVPIDTELPRHTRASFTKCSTRKKRSISRSSTDNYFRVDLTPLELSSMHLQNPYKTGSLTSEGKSDRKLDNNNNRSGLSASSKFSNISQVSRKSVDESISSDVELFTGFVKRTPEPCTTCGRSDQPERLHSHPKVPVLKNKLGSNLNLSNVVKKSVQKPIALNFRSDKSKEKVKNNLDSKKMSGSKNKTPSSTSVKVSSGNSSKAGGNSESSRTLPKSLTCYICNRDYGTASFPIHEPKCLQKWDRDNKALPPSQRRPVPQRPNVPFDHQDWNSKAFEKYQTLLVPCSKCGRTFLADRINIHETSCKSSSQSADSENRDPKPKLNRVRSGPPSVVCDICGRNFGTRGIKIHVPQCLKKWEFENGKLPSSQKSESSLKKNSRSEENVQRRKSSAESLSKKTFTCYICDRNFGSASINIHESQCLKKWHVENNKLPLQKRKKEPQKPDNKCESSSGKSALTPAELAELSWKQHLDKLVGCKKCGRTFNPDRVIVHERSCKGTR